MHRTARGGTVGKATCHSDPPGRPARSWTGHSPLSRTGFLNFPLRCPSSGSSFSGSAWAEKVASGVQYWAHPAQPFPTSQASKKARAFCMFVAAPMLIPAVAPLTLAAVAMMVCGTMAVVDGVRTQVVLVGNEEGARVPNV